MRTKSILIVDDEPVPLRLLRLALERAGYDIDCHTDGASALARIRTQLPDALITDIEMPIMTGEELCKQLHQELPERQFPIFVATSLTRLEHRQWTQSIPDLHFLEKPLSARKLLAALAKYFDAERPGSASGT